MAKDSKQPIPKGLKRCKVCGEYKGKYKDEERGEIVLVSCICDGVVCSQCKKNKIRRPISNYYDEKDGKIWHVPYFSPRISCDECAKKKNLPKQENELKAAFLKKVELPQLAEEVLQEHPELPEIREATESLYRTRGSLPRKPENPIDKELIYEIIQTSGLEPVISRFPVLYEPFELFFNQLAIKYTKNKDLLKKAKIIVEVAKSKLYITADTYKTDSDCDEIFDNLELLQDILDRSGIIYETYCQNLVDNQINERYDRVDCIIIHYYETIDTLIPWDIYDRLRERYETEDNQQVRDRLRALMDITKRIRYIS